MKNKGLLSAFLGAAMFFGTAAGSFAAAENTVLSTRSSIDFSAASKGLNVAEHSRDEIRRYIDGHPFDMERSAEFASSPQLYVPYKDAGKLSNTDLLEGRNALNVMRFIAGVGTQDVTLCPYSTLYAQSAALACWKNGSISHNPAYIQGINGTTWAYANVGAQNSNLSVGFNNSAHSVVMGYVYDTNDRNIALLGHRRWCLNPPMYLTGFGQVGRYGAMWTTDKQLTNASNSGICWPAQNMPVEYFPADTAWSISMCEYVPADKIKVTLTRRSDMRVWEFSAESADGYFNVSNDKSVPLDGCIIFRPDDVGGYSHGDVFNVTIEGLGKEVSYNVDFFALDGDDSVFDEVKASEDTSEPLSDNNETVPHEDDNTETSHDDGDNAVTVGDVKAEPEPLEFISGTNIRVTADPEVFPENTEFRAQPISSGCTATRYACDLSFVCGGRTIQPNGCVKVSIPVPSGLAGYGTLRVYHVENGRCSFVPSNVIDGRVCFTASSFSPYIITTEELDGLSAGLDDETPSEVTDSEQSNDAEGSENIENSEIADIVDEPKTNETAESGEPDMDSEIAVTVNEPKTDETSESSEPDADNENAGGTDTPAEPQNAPDSNDISDSSGGNPNTGIATVLVPTALAACAAIMLFRRNKYDFFK